MSLTTLDGEVLSFEIVGFSGGVFNSLGGGGDFFVAINQMGHEVLGGKATDRKGGEFGEFREALKSAFGVSAKGANALGDFVDGSEQLFVLRLKRGVELEEIGAFDVPMSEMGLCHQRVAVGEEFLKRSRYWIGGD